MIALLGLVMPAGSAAGEEQRFPAPEFRTGYEMPTIQPPDRASALLPYIDLAVLAGALGVAAWLVLKKRSRRGIFWLTLFSIAYFGFYKKGCICPVGSIQNVALAAGGNGYQLPIFVALVFLLPLLFTLFYGRVFCSGVCPLGAIQDVMLWRPVHVPNWLEAALGMGAYLYLGVAVLFAALGTDYLICRYDPFVGFYRMSGTAAMLWIGGVLLVASMFVGRVYCRFLCPYSVLLKMLAPWSKRRVTITPEQCVDCRLCEKSCPFGALRAPTPREAPKKNDPARRQLKTALIASPAMVIVFALLGWFAGPALSKVDFTVKLAERVWLEESKAVEGVTDESKAFRGTGQPVEALYARALAIQGKYQVGTALLGAWIGIVIGWKWVASVVRRKRTDYIADAASCVACARCYESCPVEKEYEKQREEERELVAV